MYIFMLCMCTYLFIYMSKFDISYTCIFDVSYIYVCFIRHVHVYMWRPSCVAHVRYYEVTKISRLIQIIGLFCKRALEKKPYSAKETYNSHPIVCMYT